MTINLSTLNAAQKVLFAAAMASAGGDAIARSSAADALSAAKGAATTAAGAMGRLDAVQRAAAPFQPQPLVQWIDWRVRSLGELAPGGDLSGDCTAIVQQACDLGGMWDVPPRLNGIKLTAKILVTKPFRWHGQGCNPYSTYHESGVHGRAIGSWFWLAHLGVGFYVSPPSLSGGDSTSLSKVVFEGVGWYRDQPVPVAGQPFVPLAADFDIVSVATDLELIDVVPLNGTKFLSFIGRRGGNLVTRNVRGQPLTTGIVIDEAYDVGNLEYDFWPYWSADATVGAWTQANLDPLIARRIDGLHVNYAFSILSKTVWVIDDAGHGSLNLATVNVLYGDIALSGIVVTANVGVSSADSAVINANVIQLFGTGGTAGGGVGIANAGTNVRLNAAHCSIVAFGDSAIKQTGAGNTLRFSDFAAKDWGILTANDASGAAGIVNQGATNAVLFGSEPQLSSAGRPKYLNTGIMLKPAMIGMDDVPVTKALLNTAGEVVRGSASAGQKTIAFPIAIPAASAWWLEVVIDGVLQDAGVDFTTDGTTTITLSNAMSPPDTYRVRRVRGVL